MEWALVRELRSDSNVYDRYWDAENGAAVVYRYGRTLFGYTNGVRFEAGIPKGNTQAARIRPESGQWWLYAYNDDGDGQRFEWKVAVADL